MLPGQELSVIPEVSFSEEEDEFAVGAGVETRGDGPGVLGEVGHLSGRGSEYGSRVWKGYEAESEIMMEIE